MISTFPEQPFFGRVRLLKISRGQCRYCILRISISSYELCPLARNRHPPPHPLRAARTNHHSTCLCAMFKTIIDMRECSLFCPAPSLCHRECQCSSASLAAWIFNCVAAGAARYLLAVDLTIATDCFAFGRVNVYVSLAA